MKHTTPAYWPARIMLVAGMVATAAVVAVALAVALPVVPGLGDPLFGALPTFFGVPARLVGCVVGVAAALLGLAWMVRILRGPHDEPPHWRYRER